MTKNEKPNPDASKPDAKKADAAQPDQAQTPKKSSGLIKYILFGVAGLGLMGGAIFFTLMFLGNDSGKTAGAESTAVQTATAEPKKADSVNAEHGSTEPELSLHDEEQALIDSLAAVDPIEQLVQNVDVMNAEADSNAAVQARNVINEDSIKEMTWIEKQKSELTQRENALAARQKELDELDRSISKKVMRLEQSLADRVANLAKLYDGMEPSAVASLAENLDDSIVVAIIPRMKQKNASQLLSLMPPQRAAKLSKQIITLAGE